MAFGFLKAVKLVKNGITVQSVDSGCYFFQDQGSVRAVGAARGPNLAEIEGRWKTQHGRTPSAKWTLEELQTFHKRFLNGESLTKIAASVDVEQPQLKAALKNAGLLETKKYARRAKTE